MHTIDLKKSDEEVYVYTPCYETWGDIAEDFGVSPSTISNWLMVACGIPDRPCQTKVTPELIEELKDVRFWCSHQKILKSKYYTPWNYFEEKVAGTLQEHLKKLREDRKAEVELPFLTHEQVMKDLGLTRPVFYRYLQEGIGLDKPYTLTPEVVSELNDIKLWCSARTLLSRSKYTLKRYRIEKIRGTVRKELEYIRQEVSRRNLSN